jgi:hypothetical protein
MECSPDRASGAKERRMEQAHQRVITSICEELSARPEVSGIVLAQPSGGRYDKNSDLDFYVVIDARWRQRRQFRRDGVPVELFLNPPARIELDLKEGESHTIFMLAFGRVLFDRNDAVAGLAARARERWEQGPKPLSKQDEVLARYAIVDALEDAEDVLERDPAGAMLALHQALAACLRYLYARHGRWPVKTKHLPDDLERWQADAAACVRDAALAATPEIAYAAVMRLARLAVGQEEIGFFAWETGPDAV